MLKLHSTYVPSEPVEGTLPSEALPGQSLSVTEMVARQNYGVGLSQRSLGMQYGSQGSPMIPRLNCDIFDAIDFSRSELYQRAKDIENKKEAERNKQADASAAALNKETEAAPPSA